MTFDEMVPLHSVEAEKSFLGAMFYHKAKTLKSACDAARPEWFFMAAHQTYLRVMQALVARDGIFDATTFKRGLIESGQLEETGDEAYLIEVAEAVPSPANWKLYLSIVRENWIRREIERRCMALARDCRTDLETTDLIAAATQVASNLSSGAAALPIQEIEIETPKGVSTGFEGLDDIMETRGFANGQLSIIQADTNGGKSALMVGCLVSAANAERRCLYATFADLDGGQLTRRILKNLCGWSQRPTISLEKQADYDEALAKIQSSPQFGDGFDIEFYDAADQAQSYDVEGFLAWLYDIQNDRPFEIVFMDYAQEIVTRDRKADSLVAQQQIVAAKINRAARQLKIPFVVGSQITITDKVSKTMYSRAWEQKAGLVIEIPKEATYLLVKKNRFGPKDQQIPVRFNQERIAFEEIL